ncbi:hypothetical protein TNCV_1073761 [Trichonephila clavipes]|uniref:Uncharacterized protein n=1 Tax=Trichonephila clavipes TaxID=2585209 RepID=A0A8X6SSV4_TRICX|nr:hypothetical protein TNCV_1073761 [Trichonephila clavipes]
MQSCESLAVCGKASFGMKMVSGREWQHMWLKNVKNGSLGCHSVVDQYQGWPKFACSGTHTITPVMGAVCYCTAKTGLRLSRWALHIRLSIHDCPYGPN